ncbi:MAG: hypothetical protein [Bacteriophage sp.]|nr:MAG: hypothetical protein [Bacteriophage sp.]
MKNNRAKAQSICIQRMKQIDPSGKNAAYYEEILTKMSDVEFDEWMQKLITGSNPLSISIPNYSDVKVSVENNVNIAASMGYDLFKRVWMEDPLTGKRFLTPRKHLVYEMNVSRQIQTLDHKISTATDNTQVDERTGQATGESKAAQLSGPELMVLKSTNMDKVIIELIKFRGGDNTSMRYMDNQIIKEGSASMAGIPGQADRMAKSVQTMSTFLNGMMFTNNIAG